MTCVVTLWVSVFGTGGDGSLRINPSILMGFVLGLLQNGFLD